MLLGYADKKVLYGQLSKQNFNKDLRSGKLNKITKGSRKDWIVGQEKVMAGQDSRSTHVHQRADSGFPQNRQKFSRMRLPWPSVKTVILEVPTARSN
jgi:hypothetical protein